MTLRSCPHSSGQGHSINLKITFLKIIIFAHYLKNKYIPLVYKIWFWLSCQRTNYARRTWIFWGWMQDTVNKTLAPLMLPSDVPPAPDSILKLIKCSCENCGSARCSCVSSGLPCTVFCKCEGSNDCTNGRNTSVQVSTPDDEEPDQFEEPTILC